MRNKSDKYAPICLFVFARADYTERVLNQLAENGIAAQSDVFVFADKWGKEKDSAGVEAVRKVIIDGKWEGYFKNYNVVASKEHKGLARSIIEGVSEVIGKYGKVIVVEDDLIVSPLFLKFMNETLDYFEHDMRIGSVSGYQNNMPLPDYYKEDIYLFYRSCSWGWGTWKRVWDGIDWTIADYYRFKRSLKERMRFNMAGHDMCLMLEDQMNGEIDSWSIRFDYNMFRMKLLSVYSAKPYITNGGFDSRATHTTDVSMRSKFYGNLCKEDFRIVNVSLDKKICRLERNYYCSALRLIKIRLRRLYGLVKGFFKKTSDNDYECI